MKKIKVLNGRVIDMKPGDPVWWLDANGRCMEGVMQGVMQGQFGGQGRLGAVIRYNAYSSVTLEGNELKSCWPTKQACLDAEKERQKLQTEAYEKVMPSVETLVLFMWEHMDKKDKEAVKAVKNKALALLNMELKGE